MNIGYKKIFKGKVIEGLRELADIDFQRRVWLATSGPEISSFSEAICGLFDDSGLSSNLERGILSAVFSKNVYAKLNELGLLIDKVKYDFLSLEPDSLIEHPQMQIVRDLASSILAQIQADENHNSFSLDRD